MKTEEILETASALIAGDKGILAMDESDTSLTSGCRTITLPETIDIRRAYRALARQYLHNAMAASMWTE